MKQLISEYLFNAPQIEQVEWSFGSLKKTVYRLPNNTVAMWSVKTSWKNLGYLLLNKIAPLVSPRSDKSMEEAIDTADKATSNQENGNEQTILNYALQLTCKID
ncbi:hypothetical protein T09_12279 [Trichinella sp. T9]|nr:hypothetical protein T09_12279 [Trichinella sp. T9]